MTTPKAPNKPEKLDLPEPPKAGSNSPGAQPPVAPPKIPFSIELENLKGNAFAQINQTLEGIRKGNIKKIEELRQSKVITYYSIHLLDHQDYSQFYDLLSGVGKTPKIDLFILSPGGFAAPAYKIARLCQEFATEKFSVLVPYYAKSAATILSLGADEVVMGPSSELGPIDPQIQAPGSNGSVPALALREALDYITGQININPRLASLFIPLLDKVDLMTLGHFDREIESAKQYAIELMDSRKANKCSGQSALDMADKLVKQYKTHGFVIDAKVAKQLLGNCVTVLDADQEVWQCMWRLHNAYDSYLKHKKYTVKIIETADVALERGVGKQ